MNSELSDKHGTHFTLELKDHLWRMYKEGQISADHTAREVFDQMLDSLAEWLAQQPTSVSATRLPNGDEFLKKLPPPELFALLDKAGYAPTLAHPACFKDFSYLTFTRLLLDEYVRRADRTTRT